MPSFADSIFLFVLALLLFGPKKLPLLARELGKWMGEFRRASNEFKMQMDDELRSMEQADRQKKISEIEAAAPIPPPLSDPEAPARHLEPSSPADAEPQFIAEPAAQGEKREAGDALTEPETADGIRPVPIATSGSLKMMPPATGLPTPRGGRAQAPAGSSVQAADTESGALGALVDAIPEVSSNGTHRDEPGAGSVMHGD